MIIPLCRLDVTQNRTKNRIPKAKPGDVPPAHIGGTSPGGPRQAVIRPLEGRRPVRAPAAVPGTALPFCTGALDDLQADELLPLFFLQRVGDEADGLVKAWDDDVLQGVGRF